ncbi:putative odorant receptor 69a [Halyomorpha halys]|uniref:putative odorant receptor 69a n=1 Tax=Halyomorpha halys TaxID=286706 RepID=UPI0006D5025F|nr:Odorant receptor 5 [Halyomorpha halys]
MWDWRQLRWLSYFGWWPAAAKTKRAYRLLRIYGIVLFLYDFLQLGPELIALYLVICKGSMNEVVLTLNNNLLGLGSAWNIGCVLYNEKNIMWIISKLEEMELRVKKMIGNEEYDKYAAYKYKLCRNYVLTIFIFLAGLIQLTIYSLYWTYHGHVSYIVETWVPWNTDNLQSLIILYTLQVVHSYTGLTAYATVYHLYMSIYEMILLEIKAFHIALSKLDFSPPGVGSHPPVSLDLCVKFHQDLLLLCRKFNETINVTLFLFIMFSSLTLCLSVFELSLIYDRGKLTMLIELIMLTMSMTYFYCVCSQDVVEQMTVGTLRAAYDNNWYVGCAKDQKALHLLCTMAKKEFQFGFIIPANLATFITVIKSAFSYYNFLTAMDLQE